MLSAWFEGSGERWADDVAIMGSRLKSGSTAWSAPFVLADVPDFPDINPMLFMDANNKLWLMWYTVLSNQWESSLPKYRISSDYNGDGAPVWEWQEVLHVKPGDKTERGIQENDRFVEGIHKQLDEYMAYLENDPRGDKATSFHYPAVIQAEDGTIHTVYSYHRKDRKDANTIKWMSFDVEWMKTKE